MLFVQSSPVHGRLQLLVSIKRWSLDSELQVQCLLGGSVPGIVCFQGSRIHIAHCGAASGPVCPPACTATACLFLNLTMRLLLGSAVLSTVRSTFLLFLLILILAFDAPDRQATHSFRYDVSDC